MLLPEVRSGIAAPRKLGASPLRCLIAGLCDGRASARPEGGVSPTKVGFDRIEPKPISSATSRSRPSLRSVLEPPSRQGRAGLWRGDPPKQ